MPVSLQMNTAVGVTSLGVPSISSSGEYDAAVVVSRSVWEDISQLPLVCARVSYRCRAVRLMLDVGPAEKLSSDVCPVEVDLVCGGSFESRCESAVRTAERASAAGYEDAEGCKAEDLNSRGPYAGISIARL